MHEKVFSKKHLSENEGIKQQRPQKIDFSPLPVVNLLINLHRII
ncbi:hypothetical protein EV06_1784 [Prochlorococcus sp. MIT 0602]|nr:hypothetical protein EV06_1784 [Prochlorococcus sp. MIT 0602]KGG15847.1 hypothetical protein EV07_1813 [Prochlorococcus sp. MIT 0603]